MFHERRSFVSRSLSTPALYYEDVEKKFLRVPSLFDRRPLRPSLFVHAVVELYSGRLPLRSTATTLRPSRDLDPPDMSAHPFRSIHDLASRLDHRSPSGLPCRSRFPTAPLYLGYLGRRDALQELEFVPPRVEVRDFVARRFQLSF
jgi:hypothetical protein